MIKMDKEKYQLFARWQPKFKRSLFLIKKEKKMLSKCLLCLLIFSFFLSFLISLFYTKQTVKYLKKLNFNKAAKFAKRASFFPKSVSILTLKLSPELESWQQSLILIIDAALIQESVAQNITDFLDQSAVTISKKEDQEAQIKLETLVDKFKQDWTKLQYNLKKSFLIQRLFKKQFFENSAVLIEDAEKLIRHFLTGERNYLILFQNSQEIRATGGFMGSFARLNLKEGHIADLEIQDIYEPAGQFQGIVKAPKGVEQYLSGGQGMLLPDSNWHADFPTSSRQVLYYFAKGKQENVEGVIALNLSLAKDLIAIFEPIYLPDYQIEVRSDNFDELARVERNLFFPGSQAKQHFLSIVFNQLKFRLAEANQDQQMAVLKLILNSLIKKDLQFYSNNEEIQTIFEKHAVVGQISHHFKIPLAPILKFSQSSPYRPSGIDFLKTEAVSQWSQQALEVLESGADSKSFRSLLLLESNVGVNKANKAITRTVRIKITDQKMLLELDFTNNNSPPVKRQAKNPYLLAADHLAYINYQRLITHPSLTVNKVIFNGQTIKELDQETISNSKGELFKQTGFLIVVKEKETDKLLVEFDLADSFDQDPNLLIQKQSGLPASDYSVEYRGKTKNVLLQTDELLSFW
ncbi:MAG: DUF4012 domain-containing protein [Candidatus Woesebacteria bacterium]|jgi:hypothetical protein